MTSSCNFPAPLVLFLACIDLSKKNRYLTCCFQDPSSHRPPVPGGNNDGFFYPVSLIIRWGEENLVQALDLFICNIGIDPFSPFLASPWATVGFHFLQLSINCNFLDLKKRSFACRHLPENEARINSVTSPGKAFKVSGKMRFQALIKEREKYIGPHSGEHPCTFRRPTCDATEGMLAWFVGSVETPTSCKLDCN